MLGMFPRYFSRHQRYALTRSEYHRPTPLDVGPTPLERFWRMGQIAIALYHSRRRTASARNCGGEILPLHHRERNGVGIIASTDRDRPALRIAGCPITWLLAGNLTRRDSTSPHHHHTYPPCP